MSTFDPTKTQVQRQLQGMGCGRFEIGVRSANGMLIKIWSPAEVIAALKWLRHENANGADIYVRPARDENAALILLDDLKRDVVERLKCDGFAPAVLVETSIGNFQAWIRLAAREQKLDAAIRTRVARELARRYGADQNSADAVHFGRLAGFTNRKAIHMSAGVAPFVLLHSYSGRVAEKAHEMLGALAEASSEAKQQKVRVSLGACKNVDELVSWYNTEWNCLRERYTRMKKWDASRADFLLSRLLLADGYDVLTVARVMLQHAEIVRKHDAVDYVARTVCKAQICSDFADALEKARPCIEQLKRALSES